MPPPKAKSLMEKKREAATAAYLARTTKVKVAVEQKIVNDTLTALDQGGGGVLPTTDAELTLATRHIERSEVLGKMQQTANQREHLLSHKGEIVAPLTSSSGGVGGGGVMSYAQAEQQYLEQQRVAGGDSTGGAVVVPKGSRAHKGLLGLDQDEVQNRIEQGDVVIDLEKNFEEQQEEKEVALLDAQDKIQAHRKKLPMFRHRAELLKAVNENQVIILKGETGSGKTTQMLQYLYEEGFAREVERKRINLETGEEEITKRRLKLACTQPRRLAATSVAQRVAVEANCRLGTTVGYKVRFDDKTHPEKTVIEFLTDGMLIKSFAESPTLEDYSVVMIDEAHERSVPSDLLLGLLKEITKGSGNLLTPTKDEGAEDQEEGDATPPSDEATQNQIIGRSDLRIIIASATMNTQKFSDFFGGAPIVEVEGKMFDVDVAYAKNPVEDYVEGAALSVLDIHLNKELPGDILVFMPGQDEIERTALAIEEKIQEIGVDKVRPVMICPVFANLPQEQQNLIYAPTPENTRKVVIATNIAETSITIDGIVYVVDAGLCKQNYYDPAAKMEKLSVVPISKAQAGQRKGRAGRTQKGECIRLYTQNMFNVEMENNTVPDILRSNLASIMLQLKSIGIDDPLSFEFVDPPAPDSVGAALDQLYSLGAILAGSGALSKVGKKMAEFPVDPCLSKCLVKSKSFGCSRQIAVACAMLTLQNGILAPIPKGDDRLKERALKARQEFFGGGTGDITGYVRLFMAWEVYGNAKERWCKERFINYRSLVRAKEVRDQLLSVLDRMGIPLEEVENAREADTAITKCLTTGFFLNAAKKNIDGRTYHVIKTKLANPEVSIHPTSYLINQETKPDLVLFGELRQTTKPFMMHILSIPVEFLYPVDFTTKMRREKTAVEKASYDQDLKSGKAAALAELRCRHLYEAHGEEGLQMMKDECVVPKGFFTEVEVGLK